MDEVVAINVLIELGDDVAAIAQRANQRLQSSNPGSFEFDATHVPHVSLLHRYVNKRELPAVYAAVDKVIADLQPKALRLSATGYEASAWQGGTLVNLTIQKGAELDRLQETLVKALAPYSVERSDERAFARTFDSMHVDPMTIEYVATFVPKQVGEGFKPHITVGLSDATSAERLQSQPFTPITFHPASIAIYQLGDIGTARRKLHETASD
jgi:hypothetical protein